LFIKGRGVLLRGGDYRSAAHHGLRDHGEVRERRLQRPDALLLRHEARHGAVHLAAGRVLHFPKSNSTEILQALHSKATLEFYRNLGITVRNTIVKSPYEFRLVDTSRFSRLILAQGPC